MNFRSLLITVVAGLAAGAVLGALTSRNTEGSHALKSKSRDRHQPEQETTDAAGFLLTFPDDDGRISRVFSALQQPVHLRQRFELFEALRDLTAEDLPALVKHAASLSGASSSELLPALVERWFELDPGAAQAWIQTYPNNFQMLGFWARADPEGAFQFASTSSASWADSLGSAALESLYGKDMAAKLARAKTLPQIRMRDYLLSETLYLWAQQNPAEAYAALSEVPPGSVRDNVREHMLRAWTLQDPKGALEKVNELLPTLTAGVLGHSLVSQVVESMAGVDPRAALEWLSGLPDEFRWAPSITAARQWALKEPRAALEWCMANGVDIAQANWRNFERWDPAVLGGVMETAPEETFAWLGALPAGAERDRLMECAFMESLWHTPRKQLFEGDDALVWQFFNQLPEDAQIAKAALFGEKRAEHGNLDDLGAWAQSFSSGPARANAIAGAMSTAYYRDSTRVDALLATVSTPADRDAALLGLTKAMGGNAPADAATRAMGISDGAMRREALENVVLPWLQRDSAASRSWLEVAPAIPGAWKVEWLKRSNAEKAASAGG